MSVEITGQPAGRHNVAERADRAAGDNRDVEQVTGIIGCTIGHSN